MRFAAPLVTLALLTASTDARAQVPPVPVPIENPITPEKAVLGKILFWDEQLSSDHTVACGTCHSPDAAFSDPRTGRAAGADGRLGTPDDALGSPGVRATAVDGTLADDPLFGHGPQVTGRTAPAFLGSLWAPEQFWDGRAGRDFFDPETGALRVRGRGALENQAIGPLLHTVEMAATGATWDDLTERLERATPLALATDLPPDVAAALSGGASYPDLFTAAFGDPAITPTRIAFALATYERTLVPDETPWDAFMQGDPTALTPQEAAGLRAFQATTCDTCHRPPLFTDDTFRNIGLRPPAEDLGRQDVTGNPADRGRFKVPSLRNVGLKDRFMHNGQLSTLQQVVDFYLGANGQTQFRDNQDPLVPGVRIPPPDVAAVVAFLQEGLTDPRVAAGTAPFDRPTLEARLDACDNGLDDDGDGLVDAADLGCDGDADPSERAHDQRCDDGLDNDADGLPDALDPDCDGPDPALTISAVHPGATVRVLVAGAPAGSVVYLLGSVDGVGVGPCHPTADVCADLVRPVLLASATASAAPTVLSLRAPVSLVPGADIALQAAWVDRATDTGATTLVLTRIVQP